jgi:hypothetical protein
LTPLVSHVYLAGRVFPDQHHGKPGLHAVLFAKPRHAYGKTLSQSGGECLAVNDVNHENSLR